MLKWRSKNLHITTHMVYLFHYFTTISKTEYLCLLSNENSISLVICYLIAFLFPFPSNPVTLRSSDAHVSFQILQVVSTHAPHIPKIVGVHIPPRRPSSNYVGTYSASSGNTDEPVDYLQLIAIFF